MITICFHSDTIAQTTYCGRTTKYQLAFDPRKCIIRSELPPNLFRWPGDLNCCSCKRGRRNSIGSSPTFPQTPLKGSIPHKRNGREGVTRDNPLCNDSPCEITRPLTGCHWHPWARRHKLSFTRQWAPPNDRYQERYQGVQAKLVLYCLSYPSTATAYFRALAACHIPTNSTSPNIHATHSIWNSQSRAVHSHHCPQDAATLHAYLHHPCWVSLADWIRRGNFCHLPDVSDVRWCDERGDRRRLKIRRRSRATCCASRATRPAFRSNKKKTNQLTSIRNQKPVNGSSRHFTSAVAPLTCSTTGATLPV